MIEQLERRGPAAAAFATTNRCPLGACAITGTGFAIDRQLTSDLLGFDAPTGNTYRYRHSGLPARERVGRRSASVRIGTRGSGPAALEHVEFGYAAGRRIRPGEQHHAAEAELRGAGARQAIASKALGQAGAVCRVYNTPFGDVVDTEDDLPRSSRRRFATPDGRLCWSMLRCAPLSSMWRGLNRARPKAARR